MTILAFLIVVSLVLGGLAWLFFLWTVRSGQYDDPEGPKYRMLEDEPEPRPGPTSTSTSTSTSTATPTAISTPDPTPTPRRTEE